MTKILNNVLNFLQQLEGTLQDLQLKVLEKINLDINVVEFDPLQSQVIASVRPIPDTWTFLRNRTQVREVCGSSLPIIL